MPGFFFSGADLSICRGCPHFDFAIAVTFEGSDPPRMDMSCLIGEQAAGIRVKCDKRPDRDTGERRRVTDMGGDAS